VNPVIRQPTSGQQAAFVRSLAPARLRSYRATFGGDDNSAVDLYLFEMDITAGLHQLLGLVEVAMREAMHRELAAVYGSRWFNQVTAKLDDRSRGQIDKAKQKARNPSPGKVIAEMDFGTWTCLLEPGGYANARRPNQYRTDYETDFWFPAFEKAFSHGGTVPTRAHIAELTRHLRYARNRIAHRESVVFGIPQPGQQDPQGRWLRQTPQSLLKDLREGMTHLDPELGGWLSSCDGVDQLLTDPRAVSALSYARTATNKAFI